MEQPKKTAVITGITGQDGAYLTELLLTKATAFTVLIAAPVRSIFGAWKSWSCQPRQFESL